MISGSHIVIYSQDADADRVFFRDVLGFPSVDAGHGWLIFALPPGEAAFHPSDKNDSHELYLMCDDLRAEIASLTGKSAMCFDVEEARWGSITKIRLRVGERLDFISQASGGDRVEIGAASILKEQPKRGVGCPVVLGGK